MVMSTRKIVWQRKMGNTPINNSSVVVTTEACIVYKSTNKVSNYKCPVQARLFSACVQGVVGSVCRLGLG